jgi:hypothetical protein
MSKLKTIVGKARWRDYTDFVARKANYTLWNRKFRMLSRFIPFTDALNLLADTY